MRHRRGHGYTVPAGNRIAVITNAQQDSGSAGGRVLLDPGAWNIRFAAHEMGHGYGLDHSFSNDLTYQNASWSQPGEYDDMWDEMSAQHVYGFTTANFGNGGVGFNAFDRDKLGFIPRNRIVTFGADGVSSAPHDCAACRCRRPPGRCWSGCPSTRPTCSTTTRSSSSASSAGARGSRRTPC